MGNLTVITKEKLHLLYFLQFYVNAKDERLGDNKQLMREVLDKRILRYKLARLSLQRQRESSAQFWYCSQNIFLVIYPTIVGIFSYLCIVEYRCLHNLSNRRPLILILNLCDLSATIIMNNKICLQSSGKVFRIEWFQQ